MASTAPPPRVFSPLDRVIHAEEFSDYEEMPGQMQQKVIEESKETREHVQAAR